MTSLVDLGKRLLEASKKGHADEVSMLMTSGAPFTTDWVGWYKTVIIENNFVEWYLSELVNGGGPTSSLYNNANTEI